MNELKTTEERLKFYKKYWISKSRFYVENYSDCRFVYYKIKNEKYIIDRKIGPAMVMGKDNNSKTLIWIRNNNNKNQTRINGPIVMFANGIKAWNRFNIYSSSNLNSEERYWNE